MTSHPPLTVVGTTYDLAHLNPVVIETPSAKLGRPIRTWCWFTTHTFTRASAPGDAGPFLRDEGGRQRVFCPDRYALSHHLAGAMQLLADPDRYVRETAAERNWLHSTEVLVVEGGTAIPYEIFFAVKKAERAAAYDVEMVVESAYAFDPQRAPKVKGRMKIVGLLTATVERRRVHTQSARRNR